MTPDELMSRNIAEPEYRNSSWLNEFDLSMIPSPEGIGKNG